MFSSVSLKLSSSPSPLRHFSSSHFFSVKSASHERTKSHREDVCCGCAKCFNSIKHIVLHGLEKKFERRFVNVVRLCERVSLFHICPFLLQHCWVFFLYVRAPQTQRGQHELKQKSKTARNIITIILISRFSLVIRHLELL